MNFLTIVLCIFFAESKIMSRTKRDSIGQNRLGNNLYFYGSGQDRHAPVQDYTMQLLRWMADPNDKKQLLQILKQSKKRIQNPEHLQKRSYRLRNFRLHHLLA